MEQEPTHGEKDAGCATRSDSSTRHASMSVDGMTCHSCEEIIKRTAMKVDGIVEAKAEYSSGKAEIEYEPTKTDLNTLLKKLEEKGYICTIESAELTKGTAESNKDPDHTKTHAVAQEPAKGIFINTNTLWIIVGIGAIITVFYLAHLISGYAPVQLSLHMSYGLIFIAGLLTGFHCISMCGGFVVGYTAKDAQEGKQSHKSHLKYAAGKLISYTVIGAAFGLLGSFVAFTPKMRGVAGLLAGLFLVFYGLRMLNLIPSLRKISLPRIAWLSKFTNDQQQKSSSPFKIGLLNGLMIACGPLQAIYIMAAGTGSMIEGATILFVFALGTLPMMLGFGYIASMVSGKMTQKFLKASGAVVIVLGLVMLNNGLVLTGSGYDLRSVAASIGASTTYLNGPSSTNDPNPAILTDKGYQEIRMEVNKNGWTPDTFTLTKGIPVKWVINGKEINGCNKGIQVPSLGLNFEIKPGEQVIEFTPKESGVISWSCWMGMIPGTFLVKDKPSGTANTVTGAAVAAGATQPKAAATTAATTVAGGTQEIRMEVNRYGYSPDTFTLKKGAPVKWVINGKELNGCNRGIQSPKLGLRFEVKKGEQVIEFTPKETGVVPFTCLMGMMQGKFIITEDGKPATGALAQEAAAPPKRTGGCGCGMMASGSGSCGMG